MDALGPSIRALQARIPPSVLGIFKTPLARYTVTALVTIRLLKSLSDRLSWYAVNNYTTLGKWDPSRELAVVTGGASGIGWQIMQDLVALKVKVVVLDIQEPKGAFPSGVAFYKTDITSTASLRETADAIRRDHGDPTILINNAGIGGSGTIVDKPEEKIRQTFEVNIMAHFWTVKEFLPAMIQRNHGHVISIASVASFVTTSGGNDYSCTKAAVLAFHEALTQEIRNVYGAKKIRTSIIHPLWTRTPMIDALEKTGFKAPKDILDAKDVSKAVIKQIVTRASGQVVLPFSIQWLSRLRGYPHWFQTFIRNHADSQGRASQRVQK